MLVVSPESRPVFRPSSWGHAQVEEGLSWHLSRRRRSALVERWGRETLGLFTGADARKAHLSDKLLAYHSRPGGRWARDLPNVYRLTSVPQSPRQRMLAALLWAGDDAVLSHRAAAAILDLDGVSAPKPELWVPRWLRHRDVVVHKGLVPPGDVTTTGLLRHTTLTRTLFDLALVLEDDPLELVVESALRQLSQPNKSQAKAEFDAALTSGRRGSVALARVSWLAAHPALLRRRASSRPGTSSSSGPRTSQRPSANTRSALMTASAWPASTCAGPTPSCGWSSTAGRPTRSPGPSWPTGTGRTRRSPGSTGAPSTSPGMTYSSTPRRRCR